MPNVCREARFSMTMLGVASTPHLRRTGVGLSVVSLAAIAYATLLPQSPPAQESVFCMFCGPGGGTNAILNVFLFIPLGVGLAFSGVSARRAVPAMFLLSGCIETAQYFVIPGRYSTISDVLTNGAGGALGFTAGLYLFTLLRPRRRLALVFAGGWCGVWLAIQFVTAFAFLPSLPRSQYFGEIAPSLGNLELFRGTVISAHVGTINVSDGALPDSRDVRDSLMNAAAIGTRIIATSKTTGLAPIFRIVDLEQREVVLLAQNGADLVFGERTGAAVLRLQAPLFALPGILRQTIGSTDRANRRNDLVFAATYSPREVRFTSPPEGFDRRIPISVSLGWTLLLPFQWFMQGTSAELAFNALWIAFLLIPIGYWGSFAGQSPTDRNGTGIAWALMAVFVVFFGLSVAPRVFGLRMSGPLDWLAALSGIAIGAALARIATVRGQD